MRRLLLVLLSICLLLCLAACSRGEEPPTWQTQYDLGMRYLSEGDYEQAVIAFRAAIEIDPRQPEAYISLAEAYIASEDYDRAAEAIAQGQQACGEHEGFERLLGQIAAARGGADGALGGEDGEIPLNAYGATQFEYRQNYYDFSEMTPEQQQVIEAAGNAAIAGDTSVLYGFLEAYPTEAFPDYDIFTIWNGYKMAFNFSPYSANGVGDQYGSLRVTLRPENGMGYMCMVYHSYADSAKGRENWAEHVYQEDIVTCACVDWQWNGIEELSRHSRHLWRSQDGAASETVTESTESGNAVDNFRHGLFTTMGHVITSWDSWEGEDQPFTRTELYENGVPIERDGSPVEDTYEVSVGNIVWNKSWNGYLDGLYW